eukprot:1160111-Pelagomonas_calceolata.AAC.14
MYYEGQGFVGAKHTPVNPLVADSYVILSFPILWSLNTVPHCYPSKHGAVHRENTPFNSPHQNQARFTACNPPQADPRRFLLLLLVERIHSAPALGTLFSSIYVKCVFTAHIVFFFSLLYEARKQEKRLKKRVRMSIAVCCTWGGIQNAMEMFQ